VGEGHESDSASALPSRLISIRQAGSLAAASAKLADIQKRFRIQAAISADCNRLERTGACGSCRTRTDALQARVAI